MTLFNADPFRPVRLTNLGFPPGSKARCLPVSVPMPAGYDNVSLTWRP